MTSPRACALCVLRETKETKWKNKKKVSHEQKSAGDEEANHSSAIGATFPLAHCEHQLSTRPLDYLIALFARQALYYILYYYTPVRVYQQFSSNPGPLPTQPTLWLSVCVLPGSSRAKRARNSLILLTQKNSEIAFALLLLLLFFTTISP